MTRHQLTCWHEARHLGPCEVMRLLEAERATVELLRRRVEQLEAELAVVEETLRGKEERKLARHV